jgi:phosphoglycolate phosphatase-like HAD superfamily hydrolase
VCELDGRGWPNDVQAGRAAGCRTILVTSLKIEQIQRFLNIEAGDPDFIVKDLAQALEIIRRGAAADG